MNEELKKIMLWNGDVLTVPSVNGKYNLKSIFHHMRLSLKDETKMKQINLVDD